MCLQVRRDKVAANIRPVFKAPSRDEAEAIVAWLVQKYEKRASRLAN